MRNLHYDFIRFSAMLMIIAWHFYTTCKEKNITVPHILDEFLVRGSVHLGAVGVGLFFILSGAVLWMKYGETDKNFSVKDFYRKRFIRILPAQWIGFLTAFSLTYILTTDVYTYALHNKLVCFISFMRFNFAGNLWTILEINTIWLIGEWFTSVILVTYLLFPLLRYLFIRYRWQSTLLLSLVCILNMKYQVLSG